MSVRVAVGKCRLCGTTVYEHNEEHTGTSKFCEECFMEAEDWGFDTDEIEDLFD